MSDGGGYNFKRLSKTVIAKSEANTWKLARMEWDVISVTDGDAEDDSKCICGYHPLVYLYRIRNYRNGNELFPVGSTCIHRFGRESINKKAKFYQHLHQFVYQSLDYIKECNTDLGFLRKFIKQLVQIGALVKDIRKPPVFKQEI